MAGVGDAFVKPPLFDYIRAESIEQAVAARAAHENAVLLAGGQSLIPTLNFRIANPDAVIDIGRIDALQGIDVGANHITVHAMARHRMLELDEAAYRANPLIRETLGNVAHIAIRNRGTTVGSLAHADAAAEMPALLLACEGKVIAAGPNGNREIAADNLFQFHLTTSLEADEVIVEAHFPVLPPNTGWSFQEFTRRHGDYAIAGVCALITADDAGKCATARLAACGIASTPVRLREAEAVLEGQAVDAGLLTRAGKAAKDAVTAGDDTQATTAYRKDLLAALVERTVTTALSRASGGRPA